MSEKLGQDSQYLNRQIEYDPITFSVILSRFNAIVKEMTLDLENSAWTSVLALAHDYSCGIYDNNLRQISMFDALPIHATSMQLVVNSIIDTFEEDINENDMFICNDPYSGNTHIGDLVITAPVFGDGKIVFWSVVRAHQLDTGAPVPSSVIPTAQDVWQEGLTIPPTRLVERGVMCKDFLRLYLANVRYKDLLEGDLLAQMGAIKKGNKRLIELCQEYTTEFVLRYVDEIIDYGDRRMTEEIANIPDGQYTAEGWIDNDGFDEEHIPIKVTVTIKDSHVTVDYTGSAPQSKGGINGTKATALATGTVPFLYYIDPDIPHNEGCIRHIQVIAPEGTICNAKYPAATSVATIVPSDTMQDVINKALAAAIPERVPAGSTRNSNTPIVSGEDDGIPWGFAMLNSAGGSGASQGYDGWPLYYNEAAMGGMKILAIEQLELLYPLRIERAEIEPDSMGLGQWNGGPGIRFVVKPLNGDMTVISCGDGYANPPYGVLGGSPGIGGGQYVEDLQTGKRIYFSASGSASVSPNQVWVGVSTGGGGFGRPCDRDVESVRCDVRDGIISRRTAYSVFGVVLSEDPDPVVDIPKTKALRQQLQKNEYSVVSPMMPNAATWLSENMRKDDKYLLNPGV